MNTRTLSATFACLTLVACSSGSTVTPPAPQASSSSSSEVMDNGSVDIETPRANSVVKSPLLVRGKARGTWFFEASLPVQIQDSTGNVITTVPAQADGEWMTTDYVNFSVEIPFVTSDTSGFLVIKKDNPSGLPENDDEVKIPVKF